MVQGAQPQNGSANAVDLQVLAESGREALAKGWEEFREFCDKVGLADKDSINGGLMELDSVCDVTSTADFVVSFIRKLARTNVAQEEFYRQLWDFISNEAFFDGLGLEIAVLVCASNAQIPYCQKSLTSMDDAEFHELVSELEEEGNRLMQIANIRYGQKTQVASAVLEVIDSIEDPRKRVVALALWNNMLVPQM